VFIVHEFHPPARLLMGPGLHVDPRVMLALAKPLPGHLDPEFIRIMQTRSKTCSGMSSRPVIPLPSPSPEPGRPEWKAAFSTWSEPATRF